ncbi:MAG: hypothetical protein ACK4Z0_08920 [Sphingomonadaceae bacterium]
MSASTDRAEFLKTEERFAIAEDAPTTARWGEESPDTRQSSCLAFEAAAAAEAGRQLALLAQVRARDVVIVEGVWPDLEGSTVRIAYDGKLGVAGEADMLVLKTLIDRNAGTTELTGEVRL